MLATSMRARVETGESRDPGFLLATSSAVANEAMRCLPAQAGPGHSVLFPLLPGRLYALLVSRQRDHAKPSATPDTGRG